MNKVFNINLGGYAFTIDENAYHHLKQYLGAIDSHFKNTEGFDDITTDIEIRLAEIFREKMDGRQIVSIKDVNQAINIMGTPEDFGAESNYTGVPEEETEKTFSKSTKENKKGKTQKFGKRLYRNPDETAIGGVASGVSAYFGIEDPLWVRIAFVVLIFGGGFGFPLYIILWAVLPSAKTAKQKLEMRGEKIDVNSIAKTIEEEVTHLKDRFQELGDEFKEGGKFNKKKSKKNEDEMHYGATSMDEGLAFVKQKAGAFEQFVRVTFKPLLYIIGIFLMIMVAIFWVALIVLAVTAHSYTPFLVGAANAPIINTLAFLVIGLPILSMALGIVRVFFRTKVSKVLRIGLGVLFFLVISSAFYYGSTTAKEFEAQHSYEENITLTNFNENILNVTSKNLDYRTGFIDLAGTKMEDGALLYDGAKLNIEIGESDQFELLQTYSGRGETTAKAAINATKITYKSSLDDDKLTLPTFVKLKNGKFRDQRVQLTLKIPQGKSVRLDPDLCWMMPLKVETIEGYYYGHQLVDKTITATAEGLSCQDCDEAPQQENTHFDFNNFTSLHISGNIKVYLKQGDYSVTTDDFNQHNSLEFTNIDSLLSIHRADGGRELKVYITVPNLSHLKIDNVEDTWITDLDISALKMEVFGNSDVHVNGLTTNLLEINAEDDAEITLKGTSNHLIATLGDNAELDADRFTVNVANIQGNDKADIKIHVTDTLYQKISDDADLDYDGEPNSITIDQGE